jgi:hypothetical protein
MTIKREKIKEVFDEELISYMKEKYPQGLDEGVMDSLKSAGKGIANYYQAMLTNYADQLDQMVKQNFVPPEAAEAATEEVPEAEEFAKMDPDKQKDAVSSLGDLADEAAVAAGKQDGAEESGDELEDIGDVADKIEDKIDSGEGVGSAHEQGGTVQKAEMDKTQLRALEVFRDHKLVKVAVEKIFSSKPEFGEALLDFFSDAVGATDNKGSAEQALKEAITKAIKSGAITKAQLKVLKEAVIKSKRRKRS